MTDRALPFTRSAERNKLSPTGWSTFSSVFIPGMGEGRRGKRGEGSEAGIKCSCAQQVQGNWTLHSNSDQTEGEKVTVGYKFTHPAIKKPLSFALRATQKTAELMQQRDKSVCPSMADVALWRYESRERRGREGGNEGGRTAHRRKVKALDVSVRIERGRKKEGRKVVELVFTALVISVRYCET
ncbi:hypothetical protein SRHO_G00225250 [Serrasalmus rhombeus]